MCDVLKVLDRCDRCDSFFDRLAYVGIQIGILTIDVVRDRIVTGLCTAVRMLDRTDVIREILGRGAAVRALDIIALFGSAADIGVA